MAKGDRKWLKRIEDGQMIQSDYAVLEVWGPWQPSSGSGKAHRSFSQ